MGPEFGIGLPELVEDALLEVEVGHRWTCRPFLEGFVKSFVGAVFPGTAWRDALMRDAKLEPPDVEPVEAMDAGGSEG